MQIDSLPEFESLVEDINGCFQAHRSFTQDLGDIMLWAKPADTKKQSGLWTFASQFKDWLAKSFVLDKNTLAPTNKELIAKILIDDSRLDELDWGMLKDDQQYQNFSQVRRALIHWFDDDTVFRLDNLIVEFFEENGLFIYKATSLQGPRFYTDLEDYQALANRILLENLDWQTTVKIKDAGDPISNLLLEEDKLREMWDQDIRKAIVYIKSKLL